MGEDTAARWNERYGEDPGGYFFGKEPSVLAQMAVRYWNLVIGAERGRALDLGCGEGRDAVYLAQNGFTVTGVDISSVGVEKAIRMAREGGVEVQTLCADVRDVDLEAGYALVLAGNSLGILGAACPEYMARIRAATPRGGFNAIRTSTDEGAILPENIDIHRLARGELRSLYEGWDLYYYGEDLMHVAHTGHLHSFADIVARKA